MQSHPSHLSAMVLEYFRSHEPWRPHQPPSPLGSHKLADPIVRQLQVDRLHSKLGGGWNEILEFWELQY